MCSSCSPTSMITDEISARQGTNSMYSSHKIPITPSSTQTKTKTSAVNERKPNVTDGKVDKTIIFGLTGAVSGLAVLLIAVTIVGVIKNCRRKSLERGRLAKPTSSAHPRTESTSPLKSSFTLESEYADPIDALSRMPNVDSVDNQQGNLARRNRNEKEFVIMVKGSPVIVPRPRPLRRASTVPALPTFPSNVEVQALPQQRRMRDDKSLYRDDSEDDCGEVCEMRIRMPRAFKYVKYVKKKGKYVSHMPKETKVVTKTTSSATNRHADGLKATKMAMKPNISESVTRSRKAGISVESSSVSNESLYEVTDIRFQGKERTTRRDAKRFETEDERVYAILYTEGMNACSSCEEANFREPGKLCRSESIEI